MTNEPTETHDQSGAAATPMVVVEAMALATPLPAPRPGDALMEAAFTDSIDRLEEVIDEETAALVARQALDLSEFNRRKSRSLLELTRLSRALSGRVLGAEAGARLRGIGGKLERNHDLLRMHLAAAQEVAGIISDALREAESDGTYSSDSRRTGGRSR